jgi:hypothetical protein
MSLAIWSQELEDLAELRQAITSAIVTRLEAAHINFKTTAHSNGQSPELHIVLKTSAFVIIM